MVKFKDLDPTMRKLLMWARLTEEDLKDKDTAEVVDCIINQFGGLKAVQRELRNRGTLSWKMLSTFQHLSLQKVHICSVLAYLTGPVSQTLPRAARVSVSHALKKGPLPPVPPIKSSTTSQQPPSGSDTQDQSPLAAWNPPPPSVPPPPVPERIRKSASFKYVRWQQFCKHQNVHVQACVDSMMLTFLVRWVQLQKKVNRSCLHWETYSVKSRCCSDAQVKMEVKWSRIQTLRNTNKKHQTAEKTYL